MDTVRVTVADEIHITCPANTFKKVFVNDIEYTPYKPAPVEQVAPPLGKTIDWEIQSYIAEGYLGEEGVVFNRTIEGWFKPTNGETVYNTAQLSKEPTAKIHSVKRMSDGTIWKIGGMFSNNYLNKYSEHQITGFKITSEYPGEMLVFYDDRDRGGYYFLKNINQLEKKTERPPLGITPRHIWQQQRLDEIRAAIERYTELKMHIPLSWIEEEMTLLSLLKK